MKNTDNIKRMVGIVNTALNLGEMSIEVANTFCEIIAEETGKPTTLLNKRVVFYDDTAATKYAKINDAYTNL